MKISGLFKRKLISVWGNIISNVQYFQAETNRIMEMFNKKQISEKVLQDVMNKYANEYKFTAAEKRVLQSSGMDLCNEELTL